MGRLQGPKKETQDRTGEPAPAHTCHFLFALSVELPKKPSHSNTKKLKPMNICERRFLHKCEFGIVAFHKEKDYEKLNKIFLRTS